MVLEATIPLEHVSGRIDHMAIDLGGKRLLVAELGNNSVDVIDLREGKAVHRLTGLREPQGVGYAAVANLIVVANAGDGTVRMFRGEDFAPLGSIALGDDADDVRIDPRTGAVIVGYGSVGLAVIDPKSRIKVAGISLPAHPEGFAIDPDTRQTFVNVPDAGQIAVVDLERRRQTATWRISGLRANFPMALDPARGVLAAAFRSPARLALLDARTGSVTAKLPVCADADDVFFDAKRDRIYVSCGSGEISVFQRDGVNYRPLARVATASGARTSLFVPELDRLFVAERAGLLGSSAAIRVYRPVP
ncbi:MAG: YncE family protein [Alphaproteobacteria bacterium]|nr:YncE family protein [Alphaproteobacteria bacterium]